ncbi:hypothetical protein HanIR_Chr14g0695861 [Helianthus annuus]|nr:hypothetical protein HanIR_Chr14g0695861 [Helianthus annuus]
MGGLTGPLVARSSCTFIDGHDTLLLNSFPFVFMFVHFPDTCGCVYVAFIPTLRKLIVW